MDERTGNRTEDLIKDLEGAEVAEIEDKELEGVAGGLEGNCNCGCEAGGSFGIEEGNCNCGC